MRTTVRERSVFHLGVDESQVEPSGAKWVTSAIEVRTYIAKNLLHAEGNLERVKTKKRKQTSMEVVQLYS